jgi:hypothetical protein
VPWKLTVRNGPKVQRSRYPDLERALDALERRGEALATDAGNAPQRPVDAGVKRFDPVQQVAARIEIAGPERLLPSVRGGVDVRGDGSIEAYTGRVRREVVEQRKNESAYRALRRALNGEAAAKR